MKSGSNALIVIVASSVLAAGCNSLGGRTWIPQGPGENKEESTRAPAPAPRRPVAPVAQAEPAPSATTSPFRNPPVNAPAPPRAAASSAAPSAAGVAPAGGYTQATRYGDLLFVSGQIGIDPRTIQMTGDKIEDQTRQAMENIRAILESHRLTMANVVSVTVYLKDLGNFRGMDETYETFFRANLPSRSVVEVARLPRGALVEIAVIAGR
jgi:2-iminobutanoate/2-iminopropanoate deaminase